MAGVVECNVFELIGCNGDGFANRIKAEPVGYSTIVSAERAGDGRVKCGSIALACCLGLELAKCQVIELNECVVTEFANCN